MSRVHVIQTLSQAILYRLWPFVQKQNDQVYLKNLKSVFHYTICKTD